MTAGTSLMAEQSVIGGCLSDPQAYWKIAGALNSEDFTDPFCRKAWIEIRNAASNDQSYDAVTLSETTTLDLADLLTIQNECPGAANVVAYSKIIRERAIQRRSVSIISKTLGKVQEGNSAAIPEMISQLEALTVSDGPTYTFYEALQAGLGAIETAQEVARASGGIVGAPTTIPVIDDRLRGLHGGKLIILAARPSLGKTALALQAAQGAATAGHPVGICSLEMGADEIALRSFAHRFQVNGSGLSFGDPEDVEALTRKIAANNERAEEFKRLPIYLDADTFDIGGIVARITEWHRKYAIKFAVVDHLQLIEWPEGKNRNDGLGDITRSLKLLAKRLDIPVMLLCQLNRSVEKENRRPKLADLRDSGNIEQDADIVCALHGDLETADGAREIDMGLLKHRGGQVGWVGRMVFNGQTQTFRKPTIGY